MYKHFRKIATEIKNSYLDYEGFVVIHGRRTLTYTACALSFMLENLGKPVVITASTAPVTDIEYIFYIYLIFLFAIKLLHHVFKNIFLYFQTVYVIYYLVLLLLVKVIYVKFVLFMDKKYFVVIELYTK